MHRGNLQCMTFLWSLLWMLMHCLWSLGGLCGEATLTSCFHCATKCASVPIYNTIFTNKKKPLRHTFMWCKGIKICIFIHLYTLYCSCLESESLYPWFCSFQHPDNTRLIYTVHHAMWPTVSSYVRLEPREKTRPSLTICLKHHSQESASVSHHPNLPT